MIRSSLLAVLGFALCGAALGGPLATDPNAYKDGVNTTWHGSTPFSNGGLSGYVDWAVYEPFKQPAGMLGYSRTPGEFIYVYQLFQTGGVSIVDFLMDLQNPADAIGTLLPAELRVLLHRFSSFYRSIRPIGRSVEWNRAARRSGSCSAARIRLCSISA